MKILVVDDDTIERMALCDILKHQGDCTIIEAGTAEEAFERLCYGLNPDLCFFDVRMPGMDGSELLTKIRADSELRHLRVVMTSSVRDREVIVTLSKLGISGYLAKPYDAAKVMDMMSKIVGTGSLTVPTHVSRNLLAHTILIVDDDDLVRKTLRNILGDGPEWDIVEADNGLTALKHLRNGLRPDVAILDLKMPKMDGRSLLERMRDDPFLNGTAVVIASGIQDRDQIRALAQLRISGYLLKPFDLSKTRALIYSLAAKARTNSFSPV